jgi:hypothetical protein
MLRGEAADERSTVPTRPARRSRTRFLVRKGNSRKYGKRTSGGRVMVPICGSIWRQVPDRPGSRSRNLPSRGRWCGRWPPASLQRQPCCYRGHSSGLGLLTRGCPSRNKHARNFRTDEHRLPVRCASRLHGVGRQADLSIAAEGGSERARASAANRQSHHARRGRVAHRACPSSV